MRKYHVDEVIEQSHALGETIRIVRARHLGIELFIFEILDKSGDPIHATPSMSLYGAQNIKGRYLRSHK